MTSMTGYAYEEVTGEQSTVSVEIKSVNSRFLDLSIVLPSYLNQLEARFRSIVSSQIMRGKVDISIRVKDHESNETVTADVHAAKAYADAIRKVAEAIGQKTDDIPLSLIIAQPGVLLSDRSYDIEKYWTLIEPVFNNVLKTFVTDRIREGKNLERDITEKLEILESAAAFFKEWQPQMEQRFRDQITKKFNELLGDHVDEQRIMTETAAMLVKYTINEEIVRLQSHLCALRNEIEQNPAPGKKIDFLCQEIGREINTIGSKNQFSEVGAMVVKAKDSLENIREQTKNVE